MRAWMLAGVLALATVSNSVPGFARQPTGSLPGCGDRDVHDKAERAVFKDLGALGLPVPAGTRQTILAEIGRLSLDDTPHSREARRGIGQSMAIPAENLLVCGQPDTPYGLRVIVIQNPRQPAQWGVMVVNYGVPNRVAAEQLDFVNQR